MILCYSEFRAYALTSGSASFLTLDFEENKSSSSSPPKGSAKKISKDIVGENIPKTISLFSLDWEGWGGGRVEIRCWSLLELSGLRQKQF